MKIKLNEDKYITITGLMVQRTVFMVLSLIVIIFICRYTVPQGKLAMAALDTELQSISFEHSKTAVYVGDELEPGLVIVPGNAEVSCVWELRDDGVLAIESGRIIASTAGETTLGVHVNGLYAQVTVIVKNKPLPPDSTLPPMYYDKLLIANYKNALGSDYIPPNMVKVPTGYAAPDYNTMYVTQETLDAYIELYNAMLNESGGYMHVISAYRSYARQTQLYNKAVEGYIAQGKTTNEARSLALDTTQTPGHSEHQLGTTIDVSNNNDTNHDFHTTKAGAWLAQNAHKYGFIIRYPEDKVDITRISYEPWHIRYVGIYHATYMYVNNLCLEEYVELQEKAQEEADYYAQSNPATVD